MHTADAPSADQLETFPNGRPDRDYVIEIVVLHFDGSGSEVLVRMDAISCINGRGSGSVVHLQGGDSIVVLESLSEIKDILRKAYSQ
jgi:hypothetical protein